MKKILSSLFVIFFTIISYSQSLIVTGDSIVYGHPSVFQLEASLSVKNISSNTAVVFCEKNVIQQNQKVRYQKNNHIHLKANQHLFLYLVQIHIYNVVILNYYLKIIRE